MILKTINKADNIVLEEYTDKECSDIFLGRNSYVLKCVKNFGEVYYGRDNEENTKIEEEYQEIIPERILVKNK